MTKATKNSIKELQEALSHNVEVFFTYKNNRYMLSPDPSDYLNDRWILVKQQNEDNPIKIGSSENVLNCKIASKPIKDIWPLVTNIDF